MIKGLYTSALGMTTQMNKMDVVANNIANIDTTGFKKDKVVTRAFTEELIKRLGDQSDIRRTVPVGGMSKGLFIDDVYTDFSSGSLRNTGAPLDLAISGEGFFVIMAENANGVLEENYSRDGAFTLDANRVLVTKLGQRVMGLNGEITIPDGDIVVDSNGEIYSNDEYVDTLRMTSFSDLHSLRKFKDSLYSTTAQSQPIPFTGIIEQGYVENSNAGSVNEMLDMIATSRLYEANQRMILAHDTILQRVANDIGRK